MHGSRKSGCKRCDVSPQATLCSVKNSIPEASFAEHLVTYVWDGCELKAKSSATFASTYVWDGRELKTKSGATFATTWVHDGNEWKKKSGATFATTWVVTEDIPVPVVAVVLLGL